MNNQDYYSRKLTEEEITQLEWFRAKHKDIKCNGALQLLLQFNANDNTETNGKLRPVSLSNDDYGAMINKFKEIMRA